MPAVGMEESPAAVRQCFDRELAFVHQALVQAARGDEIGELRFSAVRPMINVVSVDEAFVSAPGESTARIAGIERASYRRRDGARLASHVQRLTLLVLKDADQAGVAGEAARRFRGNRGSMLDPAATGEAFVQGVSIDAHDDLVAIGGVR